MKKLLASLFICLLLPAGSALAADLGAPYTPTRAEWLRVYLTENVRTVTDDWPLRVRIMVTVVHGSQQVLVTLKPAIGEKKPTRQQGDAGTAAVAEAVRRALGGYAWAKDLKVEVLFV